MIRLSVSRRFRTVYFRRPDRLPEAPLVFVANHHGWHDGYLAFCLVTRLGVPTLDWIVEYDAFPAFGRIGGMPFPAGDPAARAVTVRRTLRLMREGWSLVLFGDGVLRRPDEEWTVGGAVETVARHVPTATVLPLAIHYDMSVHERPEAYLSLGEPVPGGDGLCVRAEAALRAELELAKADLASGRGFDVLVQGTLDVNERWDVRRSPLGRGK
jgi:1-acyl-sn-glycerol-3-phosphate acyltransferase